MTRLIKKSLAGLVVALFAVIVYRVVMVEVVTHQFNKIGEHYTGRALEIQQKALAQQEMQREKEELNKWRMQQAAQLEAERQRKMQEHEKSFLASYQAPVGCDNWISDAHMVECVNHRMRAKAEFDKNRDF